MLKYSGSILFFLLISLTFITVSGQEKTDREITNEERQLLLKNSSIKNLELGNKAVDDGLYKIALHYFDAAIFKNSYYAEAYFSRAMVKEWLGDSRGALVDYNILIELDPEHKEGLLSRAILNYNLNNHEEALHDFKNFLIVYDGVTNRVFFRSSLFQEGTDKIITAQGANAEIYNYIGLCNTQLQDYQLGIVYFDSALNIHEAPDYYVNRGVARERNSDHNGAISDYQRALQMDPNNALASYNLGVLAKESGKEQLAMSTYDQAIQQDSSLAYVYVERGILKMEQQDYEGALVDLNKAIEIDTENAELFYNRGLINEKLSDFDEAYNDLSYCLKLDVDNEKAYLSRGNILMKMENYPAAIENYNLAIFYYPEYTVAYYNRAVANYNNKNYDMACKDLMSAKGLGRKISSKMTTQFCQEN